MKRLSVIIPIVIGVLVGILIRKYGYSDGYYNGYCQGYNEALDTCASVIHQAVKDSSMVAKVVIEDSTVTHVFYLRKKRSE
jgi:hypothetical protein